MEWPSEHRTLERWWPKLGRLPMVMDCPSMKLLGRDGEEPVFQGSGSIEILNESDIRFKMHSKPENEGAALLALRGAENSPYEALSQLRLVATDYEGNEWAGGYTFVAIPWNHDHGWLLEGALNGLSTRVTGPWVAQDASVELLFAHPPELPMAEWMQTTTQVAGETIAASRRPGRQTVEALGTAITFEYTPDGEAMWLTAATAPAFQHPFAERWLSEPLRILLGAFAYPRLTARNFGDGSAFVTLLPAPSQERPSPFGLFAPFGMEPGRATAFWSHYAAILTMIGRTEVDGAPILGGHQVTRLYEEFAQAQNGSRWVQMLTLASAAEALAKSLATKADFKSEVSADDLCALRKLKKSWQGSPELGRRISQVLGQLRRRSILGFLRALAANGVVDAGHVETWHKLRNSVMHGELVEPWPTAEGDRHLTELVQLVHALTFARIARRY